MRRYKIYLFLLTACFAFQRCSDKGAAGIFAKRTPSEKYADRLVETGLHNSNLGKLWLSANAKSLATAKSIKVPYKETGYFSAAEPMANAYFFTAKRGEKITIAMQQQPISDFLIYADVFESSPGVQPGKLVGSLDTVTNQLIFEAGNNPNYLLRLQPELLAGGAYTLTISNSASLAFPVQGKTKAQSLWGDGRDNNARKHEGVDIFANRGTPALAAAAGTVTRVGTNNLGGNVVFMRPADRDYTLYYAHLDKQLVTDGQQVMLGDTLGLVGNTGNAITTTPHLHFGIYSSSGAIDPYPFINTTTQNPPEITANISLVGDTLRTITALKIYTTADRSVAITALPKNTLVKIFGATQDVFSVILPDNSRGFIDGRSTTKLNKIATIELKKDTPVYDRPDLLAARKRVAKAGETLTVLAIFNNFNYVNTSGTMGWISK